MRHAQAVDTWFRRVLAMDSGQPPKLVRKGRGNTPSTCHAARLERVGALKTGHGSSPASRRLYPRTARSIAAKSASSRLARLRSGSRCGQSGFEHGGAIGRLSGQGARAGLDVCGWVGGDRSRPLPAHTSLDGHDSVWLRRCGRKARLELPKHAAQTGRYLAARDALACLPPTDGGRRDADDGGDLAHGHPGRRAELLEAPTLDGSTSFGSEKQLASHARTVQRVSIVPTPCCLLSGSGVLASDKGCHHTLDGLLPYLAMPTASITRSDLFDLAAEGTLTGAEIQRLFKSRRLDEEARAAIERLLWLGPDWSLERWPVDPAVRILPTITNGELGLEAWVPFGEGWEIPAGFEYAGDGPFDWSIWVQVVDGKVECLAICARSPDGLHPRPITAEGFRRLPLGRLTYEAVMVVSRPHDEIPKLNQRWPSVEAARRERAEVAATFKRAKRSPRDRRPITADLLREVAEVYRANLASGAPTRAVAEELNYSRASAGRLVMQAREKGFLPVTEPRKARG